MIKKHVLFGVLSSASIAIPLPFALQASPLGATTGAQRTLSVRHNSMTSYLAVGGASQIEVALSNVSIFGDPDAEVVTPNSITVSGYVYTPGGTNGVASWQNRTANAAVVAGATSLTTTASPATANGLHLIRFSTGEIRFGNTTVGSSTYTWAKGLKSNATTAVQIKQPNSVYWTQTPITFAGGATSMTFTGGVKQLYKANLTATVTAGLPFIVALSVVPQAGGSYSLPCQMVPNSIDYLSDGLLESYQDNATDFTGTYFGTSPWVNMQGALGTYKPLAVRAFTPSTMSKQTTTIWGDSISTNIAGWVQFFMHDNQIPYVHLGKAGESPASFLTQNEIRSQLNSGSVLLCQLGRNGYNLSSLQALWAAGRAAGYTKIIQVLPPPQTTSTDGWTTEANQSSDTNTDVVNQQVLDRVGQAAGPDAVIDTYTPCKGTDPLKWAVGYTDDGTHPNNTGIAAIRAYCVSQGYANLFV